MFYVIKWQMNPKHFKEMMSLISGLPSVSHYFDVSAKSEFWLLPFFSKKTGVGHGVLRKKDTIWAFSKNSLVTFYFKVTQSFNFGLSGFGALTVFK